MKAVLSRVRRLEARLAPAMDTVFSLRLRERIEAALGRSAAEGNEFTSAATVQAEAGRAGTIIEILQRARLWSREYSVAPGSPMS
jgi:hypothetical protein